MPLLTRLRGGRRSARVLLVDGGGRVLLFRSLRVMGRPEAGYCWLTPGGGVRRWERTARAAARELAEETGLSVPHTALTGPVARTSGHADLGWRTGLFEDVFYLYRVSRHDVDTGGFEAHERATIVGHRWWTPEELAAAPEEVYPHGLAALLTAILAGRLPATPVRLPWHH
ncbi:RNA pyrophosphohydrolase [Streptomyces sp. Ru73]|uniref:NUDIX domain-containing protein n=1 Tax=Streptomyces sp. Ru73 TaxID=2080748 RepID=UPI000CDDB407|nr:NUDIX domain-containing protein [Streptomyces sp. Ru73]POX39101.1 RNA pyrophosphohydrolase [Streptomyces sp. Ru73]